MSAIAHAPARVWAGAHRTLVLALALTLVLVAAAVTVFLLTRDTTVAAPALPDLPSYEDTCFGAPVGAAC